MLERLKDRETPDRSPSDAAIERSRDDETGNLLQGCVKIIRNSKYLLKNLGVTSRRRFEGSIPFRFVALQRLFSEPKCDWRGRPRAGSAGPG